MHIGFLYSRRRHSPSQGILLPSYEVQGMITNQSTGEGCGAEAEGLSSVDGSCFWDCIAGYWSVSRS